jgi:hypothetical protein
MAKQINDENPVVREGGCMCGAVRYQLSGPFTYSAHCHCRSCQRAVGAGFATYSAVAPENFVVTKGEMAIFHSSPGVNRGFCARCGTSLSYSGEGWTDYAIMTATLDDPGTATPTSNVYTSDCQPWVVLDPALKNFPQFP